MNKPAIAGVGCNSPGARRDTKGKKRMAGKNKYIPPSNKGKGILFSAASIRPALIVLSGDPNVDMGFPGNFIT